MFLASLKDKAAKVLATSFPKVPVRAAVMQKITGMIGRMPYTAASAPVLTPLPPITAKLPVRVLIHFDAVDGSGNFIDQGGHAIDTRGATLSAVSPKFGAGCAATSTGNIAGLWSLNSTDILTTTWTIECWVKSTGGFLAWTSYQTGTQIAVIVDGGDGTVDITGASGAVLGVLDFGSYPANTWSHRAIVRNGTTIKTYADGAEIDSLVVPLNDLLFYSPGPGASVGAQFDGFVDEFRVTMLAVYTAPFTPPSAPFPNP